MLSKHRIMEILSDIIIEEGGDLISQSNSDTGTIKSSDGVFDHIREIRSSSPIQNRVRIKAHIVIIFQIHGKKKLLICDYYEVPPSGPVGALKIISQIRSPVEIFEADIAVVLLNTIPPQLTDQNGRIALKNVLSFGKNGQETLVLLVDENNECIRNGLSYLDDLSSAISAAENRP